MNGFEKWLFPPTSVLSGRTGSRLDLTADEQAELARLTVSGRTVCPLCGDAVPVAQVCGACLAAPPPWVVAQVGFDFEGEIQTFIHDFKYREQLHLSRLLAELWAPKLKLGEVEAILPVPIHRSRLLTRGFNQSLELAKGLSRLLEVEVWADEVIRVRATQPQTHLDATQRLKNVKRAFEMAPESEQRRNWRDVKRVALLDDVMTTGATLRQLCHTLLKQAPHLEIEVWALAKATSPKDA